METALIIYFISLLSGLKSFFAVVASITATIFFVCVIFSALEHNKLFSKWKSFLAVLLATSILSVAIPKERTAYLMLAGYLAQSVVQSEHAQKLSNLVLQKLGEDTQQGDD